MTASPPQDASTRRRAWAAVAGLVLFAALRLAPAPAGMTDDAWAVAALALLMAFWWVSEALPVPATALLPVAVLPLLGVRGPAEAAAPYANPLVFLFLGGFLVALALERWRLHRRLALVLLARVGPRPDALVGGFLATAAVLSMWVSNTATTVVMLPIGLSVVALLERREEAGAAARHVPTALLLAIAFGATIGGTATLIGTPPNALLAAFLDERYGITLGFARWMAFALPLSVVLLAAAWLVLTRLAYRVPRRPVAGLGEAIAGELAGLGPLTAPERRVAVVFAAVAALWLTRPAIETVLPAWLQLTDPGIAVLGALALFLLPAGDGTGARLLDWADAKRLPWGILILFGGGLSLAGAIGETGLARWVAEQMQGLAALPPVLVVAAVALTVLLLTELTSNTATAATFLPLVAGLAGGLGLSPLALAVPATLAASCAFMLPVATPPNAIVFGSGRITIPQMVRAGAFLGALAIALITAAAMLTLPPLLGGLLPAGG